MYFLLETYFCMFILSCVALNEHFMMILTLVTLSQFCYHSVHRLAVFFP